MAYFFFFFVKSSSSICSHLVHNIYFSGWIWEARRVQFVMSWLLHTLSNKTFWKGEQIDSFVGADGSIQSVSWGRQRYLCRTSKLGRLLSRK